MSFDKIKTIWMINLLISIQKSFFFEFVIYHEIN